MTTTRTTYTWTCASAFKPAGDALPARASAVRRFSIAAAACIVVACLFESAAADETPNDTPSQAPASDYVLGHGDRIRVTVFGHDDLSGEFLVSENQTIAMPLVGVLDFSGATVSEAQQMVVDALKPDYLLNPRVSIEVLEYRPFYIIGEVNNPGPYPYVNGMTVMEAVALGGGFTYRARTNRVMIIRATDDTREERSIPVTGEVLPGDVVRVTERFL